LEKIISTGIYFLIIPNYIYSLFAPNEW